MPAITSSQIVERAFPNQQFIKIRDLAVLLCKHQRTIRNQISQGSFEIPSIKLGDQRVFLRDEVVQYLERQLNPKTNLEVIEEVPKGKSHKTGRRLKALATVAEGISA